MTELERTIWWAGKPETAEKRVQDQLARLERQWSQVRPDNIVFGGLGASHAMMSQYLWVLGRKAETVEQLHISTWYKRWDFRLSQLGEGEWVELPLIGADRTVTLCCPPEPEYSAGVWTSRVFQAAMMWDWPFLTALLAYDVKPATRYDQPDNAVDAEVALLKALFGSHPDLKQRLTDYSDIVGAGQTIGSDTASWQTNEFTLIGLMNAIVERNQTLFDQAVINCHDRHVRLVSHIHSDGSSPSYNPAMMLNHRITSLIALGTRSGLTTPPQSPYFPDLTPYLTNTKPIAPEYEPDPTGHYPSTTPEPPPLPPR